MKKAQLSLDVTGKNASAEYNAEHGIASVVAKDSAEAVAKAKELVLYLPSNNLNTAPESFEEEPADCDCIVGSTVDGGRVLIWGTTKIAKFVRFCDAFSPPILYIC